MNEQLQELATLWPQISQEGQAALLRIARALTKQDEDLDATAPLLQDEHDNSDHRSSTDPLYHNSPTKQTLWPIGETSLSIAYTLQEMLWEATQELMPADLFQWTDCLVGLTWTNQVITHQFKPDVSNYRANQDWIEYVSEALTLLHSLGPKKAPTINC